MFWQFASVVLTQLYDIVQTSQQMYPKVKWCNAQRNWEKPNSSKKFMTVQFETDQTSISCFEGLPRERPLEGDSTV